MKRRSTQKSAYCYAIHHGMVSGGPAHYGDIRAEIFTTSKIFEMQRLPDLWITKEVWKDMGLVMGWTRAAGEGQTTQTEEAAVSV